MDGDEIDDLLNLWNVSEDVKDNFLRNKIQVSHLQKLKDETLKELCPELGPRLDLKEKIISYLESIATTETVTSEGNTDIENNINIDNILSDNNCYEQLSTSACLLDLSAFAARSNLEDFDLKTLLLTSPCGKSVLNYYSSFSRLDNTRRNRLTDIIARHIYTHAVNHKIKYDEYNSLAAKIISLFPTENIGTYFVRPLGKGQSPTGKPIFAKGKLIDKIRNLVFKSEERKRKSSSIPDDSETGPSKQSRSEIEEPLNEDILWLVLNKDPWTTVIQKWEKTYKVRQTELYDNVAEFLKAWPILNDLRSDVLINLDFNQKYPNREVNFQLRWHQFFERIRTYKKDSIKDVYAKILDEALGENTGDPEKKLATEMTLLAHLVPPKGRIGKKWKFSTNDSLEGLMLRVSNPGDIQKTIDQHRAKASERKQSVQPYVMLQGDTLDNIQGIYLIVDTIKYSFSSQIKAFDTLFKLYHVFHCKYPVESEHLYLIIQRCIYDIETRYDKVVPYILDIINLA